MRCNICDAEEATVHITQTAGESSLAAHLCEACAKKRGVNDPTGFSLADLLKEVKASQRTDQKRQQ